MNVGRFLAMCVVCALPIAGAAAPSGVRDDAYGGRTLIVDAPARLPPRGARALLVVLHGGLGSAQRIVSGETEHGLDFDAEAEQDGFVVVYFNGTPASKFFGSNAFVWNAGGGCCGAAANDNVDDVAYIAGAIAYVAGKYGIDRSRVYGIGHSNGAMMTQRLMCETNLYPAAIAISGPLNIESATCPAARGKRVLAIHGADDENVPIAGGPGTRGLSYVPYVSEARTKEIFTDAGATYDLEILPGADHMLDHIAAAVQSVDGVTIQRRAARFFGLAPTGPG